MSRLLIVQNSDFEEPGFLLEWAAKKFQRTQLCRAFKDALPTASRFSHVVVLGAPESVHDAARILWLANEMDWLKQVLSGPQRVLGICLGAQLVAQLLGAKVTAAPHAEIGWQPFTWQGRDFPLYQWHGEVFSLPEGATALASSPATALQAFSKGKAWAIAGHPEVTPELARNFVKRCWSDSWFAQQREKRFIQPPAEMERVSQPSFQQGRDGVCAMLDEWACADPK